MAELLGAGAGIVLTLGVIIWYRTLPTECPGGVTIEFHPPLTEQGSYKFNLTLDDDRKCEFTIALPLQITSKAPQKTGCKMAIELRTQELRGHTALTGFTFAAAPDAFNFRATRHGEVLYDTQLTPKYAPYPVTRAENKLFCGDRAFVEPACVRGSSQCAPFPATCDGPEDCPAKKSCCATPEWGREYGPRSATECSSTQRCLDHLGHIACHADADCPDSMACSDTTLSAEFKSPLTACRPK